MPEPKPILNGCHRHPSCFECPEADCILGSSVADMKTARLRSKYQRNSKLRRRYHRDTPGNSTREREVRTLPAASTRKEEVKHV